MRLSGLRVRLHILNTLDSGFLDSVPGTLALATGAVCADATQRLVARPVSRTSF
jgi:hypothetical protein